MPIQFIQNNALLRVAIWRIDEDESFFSAQSLGEIPPFAFEKSRLQFLASRYLLHQLGIDPLLITKDQFGRPFHPNGDIHLSISHCAQYAAVAVSPSMRTGIDIEPMRDKVHRIAHKFLYEHEFADADTTQLMIQWSAKECLYKLYGERGLEFKSQLHIQPFEAQASGVLTAGIKSPNLQKADLSVHYRLLDGHVLCWVAV